jgi:hypothetical protein
MLFLPCMLWGCIGWVPGHAGAKGNTIADRLAKCVSASRFVEHEPALGVPKQDLRNEISRWLVNRHWGWWRTPGNTQRQARELISGFCLGTKTRLLSLNGMQPRVVTGLLTGHNTVRRQLLLMGLIDSLL